MRTRAIFCALWFGVLPWWVYERKCHYRPWGYGRRWISHRETADDRMFELRVNGGGVR